MRCSSCEPLLDDYLEATLTRRQMREIAHHLRSCGACDALLQELRVVDALLRTARAPGSVDSAFTAAIVSATRVAQPQPRRRTPFWLALFVYLALAWSIVALATTRGVEVARLLSELAASGTRGIAAIDAALRALAPASGIAAAAVTGVLMLDLLLLGALFYGYRRLRPMLAVYLAQGPRS